MSHAWELPCLLTCTFWWFEKEKKIEGRLRHGWVTVIVSLPDTLCFDRCSLICEHLVVVYVCLAAVVYAGVEGRRRKEASLSYSLTPPRDLLFSLPLLPIFRKGGGEDGGQCWQHSSSAFSLLTASLLPLFALFLHFSWHLPSPLSFSLTFCFLTLTHSKSSPVS